MRCPRCRSDETNLSWLQEHSVVYWCRGCNSSFELDRGAVQSTARPEPDPPASEPDAKRS